MEYTSTTKNLQVDEAMILGKDAQAKTEVQQQSANQHQKGLNTMMQTHDDRGE